MELNRRQPTDAPSITGDRRDAIEQTSDPPPADQTCVTQATILHALLESIGEPGPYVLVGHSYRGAEAVTFASLFPAEVTGLVLLDASPVTWHEATCSASDDGSDTAHAFRGQCEGRSDPAQSPNVSTPPQRSPPSPPSTRSAHCR